MEKTTRKLIKDYAEEAYVWIGPQEAVNYNRWSYRYYHNILVRAVGRYLKALESLPENCSVQIAIDKAVETHAGKPIYIHVKQGVEYVASRI